MDGKQLDRGELVAILGGALMALSLFIGWYSLGNHYAALGSCRGPNSTCSGLNSLGLIGYLLLAASIVPVILAWVVVRGHKLQWPRGELTAVISLLALTLIIFRGIIDKPGTPPGEISITVGWFVALLGGFLILLGAITRSQESSRRKKPPGML